MKAENTSKILILDNHDSFTYNLVQMIEEIVGHQVDVRKNNEISIEEVAQYEKIILSPGPGVPEEAGILLDLIKIYAPTKSIMGICLGQQAIAEAFGGRLCNVQNVFHGIGSKATQTTDHEIFQGLPQSLQVGRYHSWVVDREGFPEELEITSLDENGLIMSLKHRTYDVHSVQYHPESVLTPEGRKILENFLKKP